MPIFHDQDDEPTPNGSTSPRSQDRWWESNQREDAAGTITSCSDVFASSFSSARPLSRGELIERLKRQTPPWSAHQTEKSMQETNLSTDSSPKQTTAQLLPAAELNERQESSPSASASNNELGMQIERPKSALHRGDFRPPQQQQSTGDDERPTPLSTSPVAPWHRDFPHAALRSFQKDPSFSFTQPLSNVERRPSRSRATSQSSLSNFVLMPPTSPLVHASNNPDLDFASISASRTNSQSPERISRRYTFSPQSFQYFRASELERSATSTPAGRHPRREGALPYQAHQPRRSLSNLTSIFSNSSNSYSNSTPQTPQLRARRPSISSESPLQHAPMVGSYEESILRGRMSTTPSRPLNFVAQIGVLGKGQCKPNLKCPPHVTVPFPAVFYSYNAGNGRLSNDSPSPYVGLIDLENSLPPVEEAEKPRRRHRRHHPNSENEHSDRPDDTAEQLKRERRRKEKMKRRSTSPKAPPGGSYRIPQQGQLQIIIKNPNKTAVKLFLVPYDLSDMEPGQKTFIRQRSYSAGPIIDMPVSYRKNLGSDRPEAALSNSDDPNDRPVLRYLIHLHMCCPSKGRYYLYKSVRVVFANRVPDDKEKLRNEIQLPEPRYSAYKPTRDSQANAHAMSSAASTLTTDKALRRRSAGVPLARSIYDGIDGIDGMVISSPTPARHYPPFSSSAHEYSSPLIRPIPFNLTRLDTVESRPVSRDQMDVDLQLPSRTFTFLPLTAAPPNVPSPDPSPTQTPAANSSTSLSGSGSTANYQKWTRGVNGYSHGVYGSIAAPPAIGEGLLARRLRGLDVQQSPTLNPQPDVSQD